MSFLEILFLLNMGARFVMGIYIAHHLNSATALWVRVSLLFPCVAGLWSTCELFLGMYKVTASSVARAVGVTLMYMVIASLFSCNPLIKGGPKCGRRSYDKKPIIKTGVKL